MNGWHLDKRVPIALIVTLLAQSFAAVWWASAMHGRVSVLESRLDSMTDQRDRIIRLEVNSEHQTQILQRIERKLDASDGGTPS